MKQLQPFCLAATLAVSVFSNVSTEAAEKVKPLNDPIKMDELAAKAGADLEFTEEERWFKEAKFAMFIRWALYSQPGGVWKGNNYYGIAEWLMHQAKIPVEDYETLARGFNPEKFAGWRYSVTGTSFLFSRTGRMTAAARAGISTRPLPGATLLISNIPVMRIRT